MSVVGVEIRMFGPLPGIKYWTAEFGVTALDASLLLVLLFSGVVVGVSVALLFTFTFAEIAVDDGYTFAPFRIRYCWSSDIGKRAN